MPTRRGLIACAAACAVLPAAAAGQRPRTSVLIDLSRPAVLLSDQATKPIHPASLAKLMTMHLAWAAIEGGIASPGELLRVSARAAAMPHTSLDLSAGDVISLSDALAAMAVHSANDAAVTVAERLAGGEGAFADAMTMAAQRTGLTSTHFSNSSGLPSDGNVSTSLDLAVLGGRIALGQPGLWKYLGMPSFDWKGKLYRNSDRLLGVVQGVDGGKTGYIAASGYNLMASAVRGRSRLLAVVTGRPTAEAAADDLATLLDRGFTLVV